MISVRLERLALNQVVFREVNERLLELLGTSPGTTEFLCECSNPECTDAVPLTLLDYERVRSCSNQFVIVPGHEIPEIEQVTSASDGYFVVRKLYGAEYAEQTDPRSRPEG
jgi:aerobic-type carbon monoxide dehydrogenase small subunit (CoxS/CutS family)